MKKFLALSLSDAVFIKPINVKLPTTVGILTFIRVRSFILGRVEYEKSYITSEPAWPKKTSANALVSVRISSKRDELKLTIYFGKAFKS